MVQRKLNFYVCSSFYFFSFFVGAVPLLAVRAFCLRHDLRDTSLKSLFIVWEGYPSSYIFSLFIMRCHSVFLQGNLPRTPFFRYQKAKCYGALLMRKCNCILACLWLVQTRYHSSFRTSSSFNTHILSLAQIMRVWGLLALRTVRQHPPEAQ